MSNPPVNTFLKQFRGLYLQAIDQCVDVRYKQEEKGLLVIKSLCLLALGEHVHELKLSDMQKQVFCNIKPSRWKYWEQYLVKIKALLKENES